MDWWPVVIVVFVVALLPWQILRYARRKNDPVPKSTTSTPPNRDDDESSW